jgi:hypothetical protein
LYDKPFYGQNYNIVACKIRSTAGRKEPDLNSLFILYSKFPNINSLSPLFRIPGGERRATPPTAHAQEFSPCVLFKERIKTEISQYKIEMAVVIYKLTADRG